MTQLIEFLISSVKSSIAREDTTVHHFGFTKLMNWMMPLFLVFEPFKNGFQKRQLTEKISRLIEPLLWYVKNSVGKKLVITVEGSCIIL